MAASLSHALTCFRPSLPARLRVFIHWIVTKKVFDWFIMLVIVLSSIALASEDPVDEDSPRNVILGLADYGFTAIFTLECSLKVIAMWLPAAGAELLHVCQIACHGMHLCVN